MKKFLAQKSRLLSAYWVIFVSLAIAIYSLSGICATAIASNLPRTTVNRSHPLITMLPSESKPVDTIIHEIVARQANAWETGDPDQIVADFAQDSLFIVPGATFRGKQQIKETAESYFAEFTDTKVTIKRIIAKGNEGAIEWNWQEKNKKTGEESYAEDAIIFELEGGKIKYWREYIDKES